MVVGIENYKGDKDDFCPASLGGGRR